MKASEARSIAIEANTGADAKALNAALSAIQNAAQKGSYSCIMYDQLPQDAYAILRSYGYKLREWGNQREGYGCEITW